MSALTTFVVSCFLFFLASPTAKAQCNPLCSQKSKAAYFPSSDPILSSGACGYGSLAPSFFNGYLAAGIPSLFKDGLGCGNCFQVKCKNEKLCRGQGTKVILTDTHNNNKTDLVLSQRAFISMARKGMAHDLLRQGIVDIEYKRIPCVYENKNISLRVEKARKNPTYLEVTVLYEGGQTQIKLLDVLLGNGRESSMSRKYGAVWSMSPVPQEPMLFRLFLVGGGDRYMVWTTKGLPVDWKVGEIYDLGAQTNNVVDMIEGCTPCTSSSDELLVSS